MRVPSRCQLKQKTIFISIYLSGLTVNNILSCFVFNSLPFEISDPTFPCPELCKGTATPRPFGPIFLTPFFSHSSELLPLQLLSFDNHLNCRWVGCQFRRSARLSFALASLFRLLSLLQN